MIIDVIHIDRKIAEKQVLMLEGGARSVLQTIDAAERCHSGKDKRKGNAQKRAKAIERDESRCMHTLMCSCAAISAQPSRTPHFFRWNDPVPDLFQPVHGRHLDGIENCQENVMGLIMWLIVGGVIGWLASLIMRTDAQQGILLNIVVGVIGAVIGGVIFSGGSINNAPLTITTFLVSLVGAVVLLGIVNFFRRGSLR
jgi:uncharacterized membrane protein YeaQ/YmgE (transglycosylase-associated protein family)